MSQTYYDYGALEQLLEERERDLELAARIGQTLLEKNRQLADQVIFIGYYILIFKGTVSLIIISTYHNWQYTLKSILESSQTTIDIPMDFKAGW